MSTAYDKVKSITAQIKGSIGTIYSIYAMSYWIGKFGSRFIGWKFIMDHSVKFTAAFSNTPGPLKPFKYICPETKELMKVMTSNAYVMLSG